MFAFLSALSFLNSDLHFIFASVTRVVGHMPDVGDIHHVMDVVASKLQKPPQQITEQERAKIPNMRKIINSWTTAIHLNLTRLNRPKLLRLVGQRVVKLDLHSDSILYKKNGKQEKGAKLVRNLPTIHFTFQGESFFSRNTLSDYSARLAHSTS